jgi:hypothetical protein
MKEVTDKNFGVLIAFWIPGALLLWGLSFSVSDLGLWIKSSESGEGTIGNFLFASLASLGTGLMISAIRWASVDQFFERSGVLKRPPLDLSALTDKDVLAAFNGAVENHYRYYQYYSNAFVAVAVAFTAYVLSVLKNDVWRSWLIVHVVLVVLIELILLFASRDSLSKYYMAATQILKGETPDKRRGSPEEGEKGSEQQGDEEESG